MVASNRHTFGTHYGTVGLGAAQNTAINASGIAIAFVVQAETAGAITKVRFRYALRTGIPPAHVLTIEGLDASGNPDGIDKGGGSPTATIFTPPASAAWDNTMQELTLTNPYTPANAGEFLCVTIRYSSGTVDASNNSSFTRGFSTAVSDNRGMPYNQSLSGTWTKNLQQPCFMWYNGQWNGYPVLSAYTTATAGTAGHRCAMFLTLPGGFGQTFQLAGIHASGKIGATGGTSKVAVWDANNVELGSVSFDGDWTRTSGSNVTNRIFFTSPITLYYGRKYYIGYEVVAGTVFLAGITCQAADEVGCYPNGTTRGLATYDGVSWTESNLTYPLVDLITSDIIGGGIGIIGG